MDNDSTGSARTGECRYLQTLRDAPRPGVPVGPGTQGRRGSQSHRHSLVRPSAATRVQLRLLIVGRLQRNGTKSPGCLAALLRGSPKRSRPSIYGDPRGDVLSPTCALKAHLTALGLVVRPPIPHRRVIRRACRGPFYGSTRVVVDCDRTLPVGHAPTVVAAATVNHDTEAVDRCAWCKTLVETPTTIRSVPYHWTCLPLLMAALKVARDAGTRARRRRVPLRPVK